MRIICSWRPTIYPFISCSYYMNKCKWCKQALALKTWGDSATTGSGCLLPALIETFHKTLTLSNYKNLSCFSVVSVRPHCISAICPQFWKSLINRINLNTTENILLCYDNTILPKFILVCLRIHQKLGVYAMQFFLSLNAVKILKNASLRSSTGNIWWEGN